VDVTPKVTEVQALPNPQREEPKLAPEESKEQSNIVVQVSSPRKGRLSYDALPTKRSFRLLTPRRSSNQPPSESFLLEFTLQTYDLDNAPPFKALSYTWDLAYRVGRKKDDDEETPPHFPEKIICNGVLFKVTQNLFDALSAFQDAHLFDLLWVDAICMNQGELQERSSQVLIMGNIYSAAEEVLVWLGPRIPPHKRAVDDFVWATTEFLAVIEESETETSPKNIFGPGNLIDSKFWADHGLENPAPRLSRLALFIRSCRWFSRAWILQEVLLARNARMFCGSIEISFTKAAKLAFIFLQLNWGSEIAELIAIADKKFARDMKVAGWLRELGALHFTLDMTPQIFESNFKQKWKDGAGSIWFMSTLLTNCRASGCRNDRDKVYAILGIVEKFFPNPLITTTIKPDYGISVAELFTSVTTLILENSTTLDYLADTRKGPYVNGLDIPSWVVNFSSPEMTLPIGAYESFNASLRKDSEVLSPSFSIRGSKLLCHGAQFDTVEEVQPTNLQIVAAARLPAILQFYQFYTSLPRFIHGLRRLEVLWRTLTTNLVLESADANAEGIDVAFTLAESSFETKATAQMTMELVVLLRHCTGHQVAELASIIVELSSPDSPDERSLIAESIQILVGGKDGNKEDEGEKQMSLYRAGIKYRQRVSQVLGRRRLFRTAKGFLGLGLETVQKGDQVWLLHDADAPFVLRPTADPCSFEVVGDCYIHGFMNGEMLDKQWGVKEKIAQINIV
jgi:hypothetical protein